LGIPDLEWEGEEVKASPNLKRGNNGDEDNPPVAMKLIEKEEREANIADT